MRSLAIILTILASAFTVLLLITSLRYGATAPSKNEEAADDYKGLQRASVENFTDAYGNENNVFVGIAISGGGSRAANFAAAILQELDSLGFLKHATAISAVSGGSLTAAYYGLFKPQGNRWDSLKTKLRQNLIGSFHRKYLNPYTIARSLVSPYNRSSIMSEVFDEQFFDGKSYANFGYGPPHILLNATTLDERGFSITSEGFHAYGSRLDTFPISEAVMASSAFPGFFNNVTLRAYDNPVPFQVDDIIDGVGLAQTLKTSSDPLSQAIWANLVDDSSILRSVVDKINEDLAKRALVDVLNAMTWATDPNPYLTDDVINTLDASDDEKYRIKRNPTRAARHRLLERAYPKLLHAYPPEFVHLYDGGASDNLGLDTLTEAAANYFRKAPPTSPARGCFIFLVDAYSKRNYAKHSFQPDTRTSLMDHVIDGNAFDAIDELMTERRDRLLTPFVDTFGGYREDFNPGIGTPESCTLWHLTFERLNFTPSTKDSNGRPVGWEKRYPESHDARERLTAVVSNIATNYKLTGPDNCSEEFLQDALYDAAHLLIAEDRFALEAAHTWFTAHGLEVQPIRPLSEFYKKHLEVNVRRGGFVSCKAIPLE